MKKVKVYRLEHHKSRKGAYNHYNNKIRVPRWAYVMDNLHVAGQHPGWRGDFCESVFEAIRSSEWVSGCDSIAKLKDWFSGFLSKALKSGFRIIEYTVHNNDVLVGKSGKQIVFRRPLNLIGKEVKI